MLRTATKTGLAALTTLTLTTLTLTSPPSLSLQDSSTNNHHNFAATPAPTYTPPSPKLISPPTPPTPPLHATPKQPKPDYAPTNPTATTKVYPLMTIAEIQNKINSNPDAIIVTFLGSVYDLTKFTGHPGGIGRLSMSNGYDLDKFWRVYTQHNRGHIVEFMIRYKVGYLSDEEAEEQRANTPLFEHPYDDDPAPYPDLLTNTRYPYNAESKLRSLTDSFITPIGNHYVRNHGSVPDISPDDYELTVTGVGCETRTYTLTDLMGLPIPHVDVVSVIQCNGNRREDMHYAVDGIAAFGPPHWVAGAIGCSKWTGVRLRDVLSLSGLDVNAYSLNTSPPPELAKNVSFKGYDHDEVGNHYCCSIPFEKAIDPHGDVILAFKMNGEPIPRLHGYPVRVIAPGVAGARNCKYLEKITVTENPCLDAGNWKQYAVHAPDVPVWKIAEFEEYHEELCIDPVVQKMPVQSLITSPAPNSTLKVHYTPSKTPYIKLRGLAWGGGGSGINRVDVSCDDGLNFTSAELQVKESGCNNERVGSEWSWVFFSKDVMLSESQRERIEKGESVEMIVTSKAVNSSSNVQPSCPIQSYNPHGCCVNQIYRVPITLSPTATVDVDGEVGDFENKPSGGHFKRPFLNFEMPPTAARSANVSGYSGDSSGSEKGGE